MHAGDGDAVLEPHELGQHLRALDHGNLAGVGLEHLGIVRVDRRARHHHRCASDVGRVVAFINSRAQLRQPVGHRAALEIGAGDLHAQIEQNLGNAAHADAADTDEVRVLRCGKHGLRLHCNSWQRSENREQGSAVNDQMSSARDGPSGQGQAQPVSTAAGRSAKN